MAQKPNFSRRQFIAMSAAATGGLAFSLGLGARPVSSTSPITQHEMLPLVSIASNGDIIIPSVMSEMGQGVHTSLPQIVADELDADWENVRIVDAAADEARYGFQGTWASLSITTAWKTHRLAGAKAREMLRAAAAAEWGVSANECVTRLGNVIHPKTDRMIAYREVAARAAKMPVPEQVTLKSPEEYHIIGQSLKRRDVPRKVNGSAKFGIDVKLPGMLEATVIKPPTLGAKVLSFDAAAALALSGVEHVVQVSSGLVVAAKTYWQAKKGAELVEVNWSKGPAVSTEALSAKLHAAAQAPSISLKEEVAKASVGTDAKSIAAVYECPILAHATMEPVNFTAYVQHDRCEFWGPTQDRNLVKKAAAQLLGFAEDKITVNTTFLGGGFGRKADLDFVQDAAEASGQIGRPVKVVWSREDDIKSCIFRPMSVHRMAADVEADGAVSNWRHEMASHGPSDMRWLSTDGAEHIPYGVNGLTAKATLLDEPIPVGTLRGIAHSCTNFANEIFMDELADAAGIDPLEFRLAKVKDNPRAMKALTLVAEKAGWHKPKEAGVFQGLALFDKPNEDSNFFLAQIVEVKKETDGSITIRKVVSAADFGQPINPDGIKAQVEGGVAFALSMALHGEITIEEGEVMQSNFHDYQVLRMSGMPEVETHVIANNEFPRGCGEHINPATLPALANAISRATSTRVRKLPLEI